MILLKCAICGSKKSKFIKKQEATGTLSTVGIRTPSSKIQVILSKCAVCGDKKSKFIKEQEAKGSLNNLVIKKLLSKISVLRDVLF